jgi:hypothetical protein
MKVHSRRGPVSGEDIRQLLFACEHDPSLRGRRDAAVVYLLAALGVPPRIAKALNLRDRNGRRLSLNGGSLELPAEGAHLLERWIGARGNRSGPLFLATRTAGTTLFRRLSLSALNRVFDRRCQQAGVPPFTPGDIALTRRALQCGEWSAECCPPLLLSPVEFPRGLSARAAPAVHALRKMASVRRRSATKLLDTLASKLKPPATALSIPWASLTPDAVAAALEELSKHHTRRQLNAIHRCFVDVIRQVASSETVTLIPELVAEYVVGTDDSRS